MKLLNIISSVDPAGGGPIEGTNRLGSALTDLGHCVELASLDAPGASFLVDSPLPVHALGPAKSGYGYSNRLIPWLRANRVRYDAVIVNGLWQFPGFATWKALRHSSTPYVVFPHGMLDPWFKKTYPLKHLKKWLYWPWAEYRVLRDAGAVLFTCEEERILARTSFWLYRCNEVVVSFGTVSQDADSAPGVDEFFDRYPELRGKKLALFLGRIHPKKGCDLLIRAFAGVLASNRDWHLVMAGPNQSGWQKKLMQLAETLGIGSRITWTGMLAGAMKWGALNSAEVFVLPSHQENFGVAVAESLAAGVPALVTNKVNIWREVQSDGAGLVAHDDDQGVCDLLQRYVDLPAQEKSAMRGRARSCFQKRFEIQKSARAVETVLLNLTGAWSNRQRPKDKEDDLRHPSEVFSALPTIHVSRGTMPNGVPRSSRTNL